MIMSYNELLNGDTDFKKVDFENTANFDLQNSPNAEELKAFFLHNTLNIFCLQFRQLNTESGAFPGF